MIKTEIKTNIKYEVADLTNLVNSVDIICDNYKIVNILKKTNRKGSYVLEDKNRNLFFLKVKLKDFVTKTEIDVYKTIKKIQSEYINKILSIYQTPKLLLVFFEYVDGICFDDNLESFNDDNSKLLDNNLDKIFAKLLIAIEKLYSVGIIHCDIKPSNIILKKYHNEMIPILIDFDLSKICNTQQNCCIVPKYYGTLLYCSPEAVLGKINNKSDVWNLGMLFYLFIFKKKILLSQTNAKINYNMIDSYTGKHKKIVSLLKNMLMVNVTERMGITELTEKYYNHAIINS